MRAAIREWQGDERARYQSLESALNAAGYALLSTGKAREAIDVFSIGVSLYPNNANLYDSRAEAHAQAGEIREAIADYQQSFFLDPKNFNAEDQLAKLHSK